MTRRGGKPFSQQLRANFDAVKVGHRQYCIALALETLSQLIITSPVGDPSTWKSKPPAGYVGGAFRGGWMIGFGARPAGFNQANKDATGANALAAGSSDMLKFQTGQTIHIGNNAPYGLVLEFEGHSKQAPLGIVRPTANRFDTYSKEVAAGLANRPRR